jgi:hypothetical protein
MPARRGPLRPNRVKTLLIVDDAIPRNLNERTGKHRCTRCLAEVPAETFLLNDFLCDRCAAEGDYPLASTPEAPASDQKKRDESAR